MHSPSKKLLQGQRGLSLIEVVVAMGIVGVTLIGLLSSLAGTVRIGQRAEEDNIAVALARSQVESIKQQSYVEPPVYAPLPAPEGFEIKLSGEILTPSRLQRITVQVLYSGRTYVLDAYKVNRLPGAAWFPESSPWPDA